MAGVRSQGAARATLTARNLILVVGKISLPTDAKSAVLQSPLDRLTGVRERPKNQIFWMTNSTEGDAK
jgi:hypothetical protein